MAKRVQIIAKGKDDTGWRFVAHGARFTKSEAQEWEKLAKERLEQVKFLPV
jgi:hypothetical protein